MSNTLQLFSTLETGTRFHHLIYGDCRKTGHDAAESAVGAKLFVPSHDTVTILETQDDEQEKPPASDPDNSFVPGGEPDDGEADSGADDSSGDV